MSLPSQIEVTFLIPGSGSVKERYDMFSAEDIACWKANNKLSAAVQLKVETLQEVPDTEENKEKLDSAWKKSKEAFARIMKERQ